MVTPLDCPTLEYWHALLAETLSRDQREGYERHLESCPACRECLDRSEACGDALRRLARRVGDPTLAPADPTLAQFLERLQEVKPPVEPLDLYFLRPANRPDLLGTLGDYEVREVIGQGGMGMVLKAYEPALQRLVAIKVLAPTLAGSVTARHRFTREAQAAAAVCHDHVVAVHGVHEAAGLPYLVMQFIEGESLQERLDRVGPLKVEEVVRIGLQTASGLAAAHAQGLIHRDIKPANLLLEGESGAYEPPGLSRRSAATGVRVKITDFGLARMIDDVGLTQSGVVAGTPEYMAPEQARGESVDHRADLFSLGSVLYACCTGLPPFRGGSAVAVLRRVSDEEPTPVRELNPDIPVWLEDLILRLLAKDPEQRLQSAAEIAALLEGYLAHLQQPSTVKPPELPPVEQTRRQGDKETRRTSGVPSLLVSLSPCLLVCLLAAVGLGMGFWFLADDSPMKQAQEAGKAQPARGHTAFDFRAEIATFPALSLHGPEAETVAKTDSQGLRISLPAGHADTNPVGVELLQRLRGDFDIVLGYELITIGDPAPQYGAGIVLRVWFDTPSSLHVTLARSRKPSGELFGAKKILKGPDDKFQFLNTMDVKATKSKGKLRLVRTGTRLQYLVAEEGQDFKTIQTVEIGTDDVQRMQVDCSTSYTPIALDVRLTDLVIDANQFPDDIPTARAQAPATTAAAPPEPRRKGLWTAIVLTLMTLLGVGAVGVWLYARQRSDAGRKVVPAPAQRQQPKPEATPAAVRVQCPQCGKTSKARPELAGKKVKCPQCGQSLLVPGPGPTAPRKA